MFGSMLKAIPRVIKTIGAIGSGARAIGQGVKTARAIFLCPIFVFHI